MKRKIKVLTLFYLFLTFSAIAQNNIPAKELSDIKAAKDDTLKVISLNNLAAQNAQLNPDRAIEYATMARDIATKIKYDRGLGYAYKWLGIISNSRGIYYDALVYSNKSLNIFEAIEDEVGISNLLNNLGSIFSDNGEESKAIEYYLQSLSIAEQHNNKLRITTALANIGVIYSRNPATSNKALEYYLKALPYMQAIKDTESIGVIYTNIGEVYAEENNFNKAHEYYDLSLKMLENSTGAAYTYNNVGKLYVKQKLYNIAISNYQQAYNLANNVSSTLDMAQSLKGIAQVEIIVGKPKEAIKHYKTSRDLLEPLESIPDLKDVYEGLIASYNKLNDYKNAHFFQAKLIDLFKKEAARKLSFTTATFAYSIELQKQSGQITKLQKEKALQGRDLAKEKLAKNTSIAVLGVLLVVAFILLRNIRQRKKLNSLLYAQKEEIGLQKSSVEATLAELKSTQSQLIHAEKMASLGELTAGIAHEIQNPLNFVNNFSEVNAELIEELRAERAKAKTERDEELLDELLRDIAENEKKINHHGKRADAIVKGMLQHSQASTGQKELTNLNRLAEEYLRLSYLGVRAKDKLFNATINTQLDPTVHKIKIIPQDIGKVIVNLLSNAFYVVNEKKHQNPEGYEPTVTLTTKKLADKVEIRVQDNGNGIPKKILDKVFQPFFTTKPTGQGTGLGLSLSYDIVKAHGGLLSVETEEGKGTEFVISIPL